MAKTLSQNCSTGKHNRCLGTVILFPPVDGVRIGRCQCDAADCPHAVSGVAPTEASA